ncbi:Uncharacterised protein [Amycolatopsis camponoti]|uniref:Uncharacterized protein n=1 Tax=Amycolatopsis camponoti TaxID=2606593 RepID=A0A6I8LMP2_9PSEU|nr:Uncharacterised protein [Amycolatopsis camponoti]
MSAGDAKVMDAPGRWVVRAGSTLGAHGNGGQGTARHCSGAHRPAPLNIPRWTVSRSCGLRRRRAASGR